MSMASLNDRKEPFVGLRPAILALSLFLTLLAACDTNVQKISQAAESTRDATEHAVEAGDAANAAREARVLADAEEIQQRAAERIAEENGGRPRYEIRKEADGWAVYDTENNRPARVGAKLQSGLKHDQAEAVFNDLQTEEVETAAQFGPPRAARTSRK